MASKFEIIILKILEKDGVHKVNTLTKKSSASTGTVRSILKKLTADGRVKPVPDLYDLRSNYYILND